MCFTLFLSYIYSQSAIQQMFHASNQSASTKEQICTVVQLITRTIHQIYAVFYNATDEGQDKTGKSKWGESQNLFIHENNPGLIFKGDN